MDIENYRYTNVQNCFLLKFKCDRKNCATLPPPPSNPKHVPKALCVGVVIEKIMFLGSFSVMSEYFDLYHVTFVVNVL